jgi:hypothetical protein
MWGQLKNYVQLVKFKVRRKFLDFSKFVAVRPANRLDQLVLEDLQSRNGTYVNRERINSKVIVTPSDARYTMRAPRAARRRPADRVRVVDGSRARALFYMETKWCSCRGPIIGLTP